MRFAHNSVYTSPWVYSCEELLWTRGRGVTFCGWRHLSDTSSRPVSSKLTDIHATTTSIPSRTMISDWKRGTAGSKYSLPISDHADALVSTNFAKAARKLSFRIFSLLSSYELTHSVLLILPTTQSRCAGVRLCLQYNPWCVGATK